jgi:hypothetical protein
MKTKKQIAESIEAIKTRGAWQNAVKIPLNQITIICYDCGDKETAENINNGNNNYHRESNGVAIRFPKEGLSEDQILKIPHLRCECCQEDYEDQ